MELSEIEAFLAIVDNRTFTNAAASLGISQPAISRRIDLLETDLESPLFQRDRGGARLTPAGEAFLPFARSTMANIRDGLDAVREVTKDDQGDIVLALVGTLASTRLLDILRRFREEHDAIRVRVHTANSKGVSELVHAGNAVLGLRYFAGDSPTLEHETVAHEDLVIARAPASRITNDTVRGAQDLEGAPWVAFPVGAGSSGEPFALETERALVRLGLDRAERIQIDSLTAQKRLIEADFGIGLLPGSAITEEVRLGTLEAIHLPGFHEQVPITLVQRKDGFRSRAISTLIEALRDNGS